jgi:hypothetical protein
MAKGNMGLLIGLGEKPKGKAMEEPMESESEDSEYDTPAKTDLAQKFFEAASSGDFEKAGMVMEKFVHLCTGV